MAFEWKSDPFEDTAEQKEIYMTAQMKKLTEYHRDHCIPYRRMLDAMGYDSDEVSRLQDIPYLPVTLFKKMRLGSLREDKNYKVVTSSGTGGQNTSQIILDGDTRIAQQQALACIGSSFLGKKRLPMLVVDCPSTMKKRDHFSARTSGILGFSLFGKDRTFALSEDMSLNQEAVQSFFEKYGDGKYLIFGFTFMIWKYFLPEMEKIDKKWDGSGGILVHGGGWKKLISESVSKKDFSKRVEKACKIHRVIDYYGMAEQTGSIFMECECGHLHCSDYSAILFRRPEDFSVCEKGEKGLIQVMSVLPKSYPGHSLLTEDEGRLLGADDCPCGRKGVYFEVLGRVQHAELRGCSDTFASEHGEGIRV